ncbi:MAG: ABC transporter substrate-binding protein [Lachnospiraceae bacterium]|nr:ABC transporter substrate-binding protein [Lachnospiraceae bacterium]
MHSLKKLNRITAVFGLIAVLLAGGCGVSYEEDLPDPGQVGSEELITVGFSQVGAESDWRKANTESMQSAFTRERGYELIFEDAQQKQSNQITAIRTFIQREVDYIVLAPVTEDGWDTVLAEARDANIPVIIVDRQVAVKDKDLFTCWIGSDFELEAKKACTWLEDYCRMKRISANDIYIADIQGTIGSSAQIGRSKGLKEAVRKNGWHLVDEVPGEYTQAKGREATARLLQSHKDLNVIYCENDNEAFGALEAIEAAGRKAGGNLRAGEIMVISFDGVSELAIDDLRNDSISCIGECNPLHGPRVRKVIDDLENNIVPEKYEYVDEDIFSAFEDLTEITVEGKNYPVKIIGK